MVVVVVHFAVVVELVGHSSSLLMDRWRRRCAAPSSCSRRRLHHHSALLLTDTTTHQSLFPMLSSWLATWWPWSACAPPLTIVHSPLMLMDPWRHRWSCVLPAADRAISTFHSFGSGRRRHGAPSCCSRRLCTTTHHCSLTIVVDGLVESSLFPMLSSSLGAAVESVAQTRACQVVTKRSREGRYKNALGARC